MYVETWDDALMNNLPVLTSPYLLVSYHNGPLTLNADFLLEVIWPYCPTKSTLRPSLCSNVVICMEPCVYQNSLSLASMPSTHAIVTDACKSW